MEKFVHDSSVSAFEQYTQMMKTKVSEYQQYLEEQAKKPKMVYTLKDTNFFNSGCRAKYRVVGTNSGST